MKLLPSQSVSSSLHADGNKIFVQRRQHIGFPIGTNKADEYSWFFLLALSGQKHEPVTLLANMTEADIPGLTRNNSLLYYSPDQIHWRRLTVPVFTDSTGLKQYSTFNLPITGPCFISNTIFYDYAFLDKYFTSFAKHHNAYCRQMIIGTSLENRPLRLITLANTASPLGRILLTTGCHPAEPDVIASQAILDWLVTPPGLTLLRRYQVDVLPLSNPDGFATHNCLTSNGINLYWNFMKDDQKNCPEAYYLWRYILSHPPLLYLDFHSYVHQYHRHPMPYLKDTIAYRGAYPKHIVKQMDRLLIKQSQGFYRFGKLAMWPHSLSHFITEEFNTISYTKYHFNLYEGIAASRSRAVNIFTGLTDILLRQPIHQKSVLIAPHGQAAPDYSDRWPYTWFYQLTELIRKSYMFTKSYFRYYRHRNQSRLFR